ncbi:MAG: hypothetical protein G3W67_22265, partial [Xanthomonas perforans]|nr:hypothetical protein [Xanthomonas perforans]
RFQLEALMPAVPGVVVLHDGFLSDYHNWAAQVAGVPERFRAELFESHGYPALLLDAREGRDEALRRFSCTGGALGGALAVIHHSEHGRALSAAQLGPEAPPLHVVPLLRRPEVLPERAAARRALGLDA